MTVKNIKFWGLMTLQVVAVYFKGAGQSIDTFKDQRDGHIYKTVKIGNQTWMADNLAYLPAVSPPTSGTEEEAKTEPFYYVAFYIGTDVSEARKSLYFQKYGVLYNWVAAKTASPPGWHVATDADWKTLEMYLGMPADRANDKMFREEGKVGYQLKSKTGWSDTGSDAVIFSALPGGYRMGKNPSGPGDFEGVDKGALFWTGTTLREGVAWRRQILGGTQGVVRFAQVTNQGYSVRCVKDN